MKLAKYGVLILLSAAVCASTMGCGLTAAHHRSSSVVQYLYPDSPNHVITPGIPHLALPLHVGIAFVPENSDNDRAITERDKIELMKQVGRHFIQHDFVKSIELIPSAYLREEGGFANLDQIRTMYGIDVIALLSYDQTQFTDEGLASITYWTLIGAYLIPGEKNDTHTMVDAVVYDIPSRKLLFRAPGTNHIKSKATPVNLSEQLRHDRLESFKASSADLVENLAIQLELFREKVKETPEVYQITHRNGYTGGGSLDTIFITLLCLISGYGLCIRRMKKA